MKMELFFHTLQNGIRLVHCWVQGNVAHCGLIINAGSRDENSGEQGIAHFIEHMLFKGTLKRKTYHVLSRLENVGGELNAYTTKEDTTIYASVLKNDYERAVELISDIAFNSVFPEKEIAREKDVVIEEIKACMDNPAELIFDEFEELLFAGQPVGHAILGTLDTVNSFTPAALRKFIDRNYNTDQMVFCSVGEIPVARAERLFTRYFSHVPPNHRHARKESLWTYKAVEVVRNKDTYQDHCIIGNVAYDLRDERRLRMFLLNNILGGQGLNSRLNLSLREKKGLVYNVESSYNPYYDTGAFTIYFGTDHQHLEKSMRAVNAELHKLRTRKLGTIQLSKAANQLKGYLARSYDNHEGLMLGLGKSLLVFNKIESLEETSGKIDRITSSELIETANEVFDPDSLSTLIYRR